MSKLSTGVRRVLIGQPFRSDELAHTLLPNRIALPVFASDATSSAASLSAYAKAPWIGLAVAGADYHQRTLVAQLAHSKFYDFPPGPDLITGSTALIVLLAADTAFNGFPVRGFILAQGRHLPRLSHARGGRLAFSNVIGFTASPTVLTIKVRRLQERSAPGDVRRGFVE